MQKLFLALLLLPTMLRAQEEVAEFPVIAYWSTGDAFFYEITKSSSRWENGERLRHDSSTYTALFEVLDSTENSYELAWTPQAQNASMSNWQLPDSIINRLQQSSDAAFYVAYSTDELGSLNQIHNISDIRMALLKRFAIIEDMLPEQESRDAFQKALAPMKQLYLTDEGIQELVLQELVYFHFLYGIGLDQGETYTYEELIPNPFGKEPLKAQGQFWIASVDTLTGRLLVVCEVETNPGRSSQQLMVEILKTIAPEQKVTKKQFKNLSLVIKNRIEMEFYYGYYLPHEIRAERNTILSDKKSVKIDRKNCDIRLMYEEE